MLKKLTLLVLSGALGSMLLLAQNSGRTFNPANSVPHQVNFLTTLLSLTSTQQQQATTIFTTAATADATVHSSMKTARQSLATAVKSNDTGAIQQASTTIGNLTAQLVLNQATADAAFYQILTPEQQTKLSQFESQSHGRLGSGMRPGGFGGGFGTGH